MPDKELRISNRKVKNSNKLCPTSIDERVFSYLSLLDFALRCPFFLCAILYFLFSFSGKYYNQRHTIDSVRIVCSWYIYLGNAPPLMVSYSLQTFILKAPKKKSDNFLFAFLISSHSVLYSRFFLSVRSDSDCSIFWGATTTWNPTTHTKAGQTTKGIRSHKRYSDWKETIEKCKTRSSKSARSWC